MNEAVIFQRRHRLKRHFVTTSNVLLYGYAGVSDAAKITYQVIDGFDWESKDTGDSKGYVFPAVETLAMIRHTTVRTIQRHLKELEAAKLLTRQRRQYKPSVLLIEDVSEAEDTAYERQYLAGPKPATKGGEQPKLRSDKTVVSRTPTETTKMSFARYMKENEKRKEKENNVNADHTKEQGRVDSIRSILMHYEPIRHGAQNQADPLAKREYVAELLADQLSDRKSLGCYRHLAEKIPPAVLLTTLATVKEQAKDGTIRTRPGAVFIDHIKRYAAAKNIALHFGRRGEDAQ